MSVGIQLKNRIYKTTELGKIPEEWIIIKLVDLVERGSEGIRRGPFGGALKKEYFVPEGYAVYEQQNIIHNQFQNNRYFINKDKYDELTAFSVNESDILISCSGTVGKVAIVPPKIKPGIMNQALLRFRANKNYVDRLFLFYMLSSEGIQSKIINLAHGSTIKNIAPISKIKQIKVALPPLEEQQKITKILSTVDKLIKNIDELLVKNQELKKGLMQKLLTKGIGHTKFKQTKLGEIPVTWNINRLGDNGAILEGFVFKSKYFSNERVSNSYQLLKMGNVKMGKLNLLKSPTFLNPNNLSDKHYKYILSKGDIIISLTGTIGKKNYGNIAIIDQDNKYLLNQRVACFRSIERENSRSFYYYYMQFSLFRESFFQLGRGGTGNQTNVSSKDLANTYVISPPIEDQRKIATILSTMDEQIENYEREKEKHIELKKELMKQLLKGKLSTLT